MPESYPLFDQPRRSGSTSRSSTAASRMVFSVVSQPMQPSVTEQPYLSWLSSAGIGWLPASLLDSIITPRLELLACEQSTTMLAGSLALAMAASATAIDTVS